MADTARITATLPTGQVAEPKKPTDNVSGYAAMAVARQLRHALGEEPRRYEDMHGAFADVELAGARAGIPGAADAESASAA